MSNRGSKLERIIESDQPSEHHDTLDIIANHVVAIIFISLLFLGSVFMFLNSEPSGSHATAYAIIDFKSMSLDTEIFDSISSAIEDIRSSNDQPYLLLTLFVGWIMVVGLINIALHEKEAKKEIDKLGERKGERKGGS